MRIPNILNSYCDSLNFYGQVIFSDSDLADIKTELALQSIAISAHQVTKVHNVELVISLDLLEKTKKENFTLCNFDLKLEADRGKEPVTSDKIDKALNLLVRKKIKASLASAATFYFPKETFESIIPLPLKLPNAKLKDISIGGLRIVFEDKELGEYSDTLDSFEKYWYHYIYIYRREVVLSDVFIEDSFKKISELSTKLLESKSDKG